MNELDSASIITAKTRSTSEAGRTKETIAKEVDYKARMRSSQLMKLFEEELKDIYWVEKIMVSAIPIMIKHATSEKLILALESHLKETGRQLKRVEQVFDFVGKKATAKKSDAMEGLIKEAERKMGDCDAGPMCDANIISAAQKVEHYEIASYGTLHQFAVTLGLTKAADLILESLSEEYSADRKLTEVAVTEVNIAASEKMEEEKPTTKNTSKK